MCPVARKDAYFVFTAYQDDRKLVCMSDSFGTGSAQAALLDNLGFLSQHGAYRAATRVTLEIDGRTRSCAIQPGFLAELASLLGGLA